MCNVRSFCVIVIDFYYCYFGLRFITVYN